MNWYAAPKSMTRWTRDWVRGENGERVLTRDQLPSNLTWCRGVDKAHTEPHAGNRYPDYTALSPRIGKDSDGLYYLVGEYLQEIIDPPTSVNDKPVIGRFRKGPGPRDSLIIKQAKADNEAVDKCTFVFAKESGAGKSDATYTKAKFTEEKLPYEEGSSPGNTPDKKIKDFSPFANACQQGLVYIVEESFHPATLRAIYLELEIFNGERSTSARHDDWADSIALGFNYLVSAKRPYSTPGVRESSLNNNNTLAGEIINKDLIKDFYEKRETILRR